MDDFSLPKWETPSDTQSAEPSPNPPAYSLHPSAPFEEDLLGAVGGVPSVTDGPRQIVIHHHHHYHYHSTQQPHPARDRTLADLPTYDEATSVIQPAPPAPFANLGRPSETPDSSQVRLRRERGIPVIESADIANSLRTANYNTRRCCSSSSESDAPPHTYGATQSENSDSPIHNGFDLDALFDEDCDGSSESPLEINESCVVPPPQPEPEQEDAGCDFYDRPIANDILPRLANISARSILDARGRVRKAFLTVVWQLKQFHSELSVEEAWLRLCTRFIEEGDFERRGEVEVAWEFAFRLSPSIHFKSLYASSVRDILEMMRSD